MNFTETKAHKKILEASSHMPHVRVLLDDMVRNKYLTIQTSYLSADFSRQKIDLNILHALFDMLDEINFDDWRHKYFAGEKINNTEGRPVLHMAMRADKGDHYTMDGKDILPDILGARQRMFDIANHIRANKNIKNIISIGIGGSDLGPRFICDAFQDIADGPKIHFVSNVDVHDLLRVLKQCSVDNTLFLVASKTFTTVETMLNAQTALKWAQDRHDIFYAITSNVKKALEWGVTKDHILSFPEWVGGRFSLWSSIGLPIAIAFGARAFSSLLTGARQCDHEFQNNEYKNNIPVMMALVGLYNRNYLKFQTHLMAPYDARLRLLSKYIQQMDMESNGKSVDRDGNDIDYETAPQIYGEAGTDCQHSYMQMIHQGKNIVPVDFIGVTKENSAESYPDHYRMLISNMKAQADALAIGQTLDEAKKDPFRVFRGDRPSTIFGLYDFNFETIGYLIAAYEHKVFTQGILWNLNSYDQPGVELGKALALKEMQFHGS